MENFLDSFVNPYPYWKSEDEFVFFCPWCKKKNVKIYKTKSSSIQGLNQPQCFLDFPDSPKPDKIWNSWLVRCLNCEEYVILRLVDPSLPVESKYRADKYGPTGAQG